MKIMKGKKAYTLVELVVVLGIASILTVSIMKCMISGIAEYTKGVSELIVQDNIDNAMLNLEGLCKSNLIREISCNEIDNSICIKYINEINSQFYNKKIIEYRVNKLWVKTINNDGGYITEGDNVLLAKISDFEVKKKGKLIYFKIKLDNGVERIRCI